MATSLGVKLAGTALLLASAAGGIARRASGRSCVLGVFNSAATATVSGAEATGACERLATLPHGNLYLRTVPVPTSDVVLCELDGDGLHWVVRDRAESTRSGQDACFSLRQKFTGRDWRD